MLIINANSSLKFHSIEGITSKLNMPVFESITGQRSAPQKKNGVAPTQQKSLTIPHENREYIVSDEKPRNQIREGYQHSFKGVVQGLEYRLARLAERYSQSGTDYEDLLLCWGGEYLHFLGQVASYMPRRVERYCPLVLEHNSRTTASCGSTMSRSSNEETRENIVLSNDC